MEYRQACLVSTWVVLVLAVPSAAGYASWYAPSPDQVVGYLTWNDGGGIAWNPQAPSQDPGGPAPDPTQDELLHAGWMAYSETGIWPTAIARPAPDVFTSQPVPRTLHLDPRRGIEVDLLIYGIDPYSGDICDFRYENPALLFGVGGSDPNLGVSLTLNDEIVGGVMEQPPIYWWQTTNMRPPDPASYVACHYRFHPEMATIPAGSVLKLTITHIAQSKGFQYGMQDDHRSVIRFTPFSDVEWAYRGTEGSKAPAIAAPSSTASAAPLLGLGLLGFRMRGRQARPALLVAVIFVAGAFAGCLGGEASSPAGAGTDAGGSVDVKVVKDENNTLTSKGNGSLFGEVYDDLGVPQGGAHVSLLGTNLFTTTTDDGRFQFTNLPPAFYTMRIDKKEFKSFETRLEIRVGAITRPVVHLEPLVSKGADFRPHRHDYWAGETSKVVMDRDVDVSYCYTYSCWPPFEIPPADQGVNTVLPGTSLIEVVVNWDAAAIGFSRLGMAVQYPGVGCIIQCLITNSSYLYPRESGEPFRIQTTWEMDDPGHSLFSAWSFSMYGDASEDPTPQTLVTKELGPSEPVKFHVKVTIHRGVVPLEPEHPDHWQGSGSALITKNTAGTYHDPLSTALWVQCPTLGTVYGYTCNDNWAYFGASKGPVFYDATWLEIFLNVSKAPTPDFHWDLHYRSAKMSSDDNNYAQWPKPPPGTRDGLSTRYVLPLKEGEADSVYAEKSTWSFVGIPDDETSATLDHLTFNNPNAVLTLTVIGHKGTAPA